MFKRIDHVEIVTDKPAETIAFYTGLLGFRIKAQDRVALPGDGKTLDLAYLDLGGTTIELMTYGGVAVAPPVAGERLGYRMIAIEVEDMRAALDYLGGHGVPAVWGPVFRDAYARAEIADPNGFHIELRQWAKPRPA